MGKLFELLAVEPDLRGASEKIVSETINTFSKKPNHFEHRLKTYQPKDEDGDVFAPEKQEMVTTVLNKLNHAQSVISKYIDAIAQKETTNTKASAYLEVNGQKLLDFPLPATLLLALEGKLKQLREIYNTLPTLDPSESWRWDDQTKTYEAEQKETYKTKKIMKNHVLSPSTEKFPANVQVYHEDVRIGTWLNKRWSGCITPAEKSAVLERLDILSQAVKKARQRANDKEIEKINISKNLFDFIHKPLKK